MCFTFHQHVGVCDSARCLVGIPSFTRGAQTTSGTKSVDMLIDPFCTPTKCICSRGIESSDSAKGNCEFHPGCCRVEIQQERCRFVATGEDVTSCRDHLNYHQYFPSSSALPGTPLHEYPYLRITPFTRDLHRHIFIRLGRSLAGLARDLHAQNTRLNANSSYNTSEPHCEYSIEQINTYNRMFDAADGIFLELYRMLERFRNKLSPEEWAKWEYGLRLDESRQDLDCIPIPMVRVPDSYLHYVDKEKKLAEEMEAPHIASRGGEIPMAKTAGNRFNVD